MEKNIYENIYQIMYQKKKFLFYIHENDDMEFYVLNEFI